MDTQKRTITKTLLWVLIANITTMLVVFAMTGDIVVGASAALVGMVIKLFMYYFYERYWSTVEWGRVAD